MELIAHKYRVLKKLGQGAMGEVHLVLPPHGDPVALKLLKSLESEQNSQAIEQFENEFKILKRLSHPNIGRIFDYGFDEQLGKVFFTLPWLQGKDIYEATENLDYETCEEYFVQTLRALNYLHQKQLIHCDLKPGNIFIENNQLIIIDFGLAGYWGENIVGTPTYLAPEIFHGTRHTIASDLYAVGVIFYNCFTRSQPFSGKDLQEVYDRHRAFTPPPIHEINPNVPKYMSDIIATLLNKKPEERYPSAAAVIEEIATYAKKSYSVETEETLLSYLPTDSEITAKEDAVNDMRTALQNYHDVHNKEPYHLLLVHGQKNVGKARFAAKIKNELQLAKISVENISTPLTEEHKNVIKQAKAVILENLDTFFLTANELMSLKQITDLFEQKILSTTATRYLFIITSCDESRFNTITKLFPLEETQITTIQLLPYNKDETRTLLKNILGQEEIPEKFIDQFHHNTEGLPGVALDLIQSMIANGLLFDKAGRWNEDLLNNLESAMDSMQISETLEQEFEKTYDSLTGTEEDVVNWLSICPHVLSEAHLQNLTQDPDLKTTLQNLLQKKIIREDNNLYALYRSVFQNFVQNNLPDAEVKRKHTLLALPKIGLDKKWAIYHLSLGDNPELRRKANIKLAQSYENQGEREKALQCYLNLIKENKSLPLSEKISWYIEAASLMIWLDKFTDTTELINSIEQEIQRTKASIPFEKFLILLEKKGLSFLHQYQIEKAKTYFETGLKYALKSNQYSVSQLRFDNNLAEIQSITGQRKEALGNFHKTREQARQLALEKQLEITNNDLGHVCLLMEDFENAKKYLSEDIELFSKLKNQGPLARALYSYAEALRLTANYEAAIDAFNKCTKLCREDNNHPLLLRVYNGLGNTYLSTKQSEDAITNYQKAIDIAVRLRELTSKAALLYNQGIIYHKEENHALAQRRFLMAKQVLETKEGGRLAYDESLLSRCYNELAAISYEEKNTLKALGYQLERMKLVTASETLRSEKFEVKMDLAKLYLENRLEEQFRTEVQELEKMAKTDEQKLLVSKLSKQWDTIQNHLTQEETGKIIAKTE